MPALFIAFVVFMHILARNVSESELSSWMLKAKSMGPSGSSCFLRPPVVFTLVPAGTSDFRPTFFALMACIAFLDMVFNAVFAFLAFIALVDMVFIAVFASEWWPSPK